MKLTITFKSFLNSLQRQNNQKLCAGQTLAKLYKETEEEKDDAVRGVVEPVADLLFSHYSSVGTEPNYSKCNASKSCNSSLSR